MLAAFAALWFDSLAYRLSALNRQLVALSRT